jgi:hypothetical protein
LAPKGGAERGVSGGGDAGGDGRFSASAAGALVIGGSMISEFHARHDTVIAEAAAAPPISAART